MKVIGLDIGSRTIALTEIENGILKGSVVCDTTHDPLSQCQKLLKNRTYDSLFATGYGRHLARANFATDIITEIRAFSLGARYFNPSTQAVLDIGGQDIKVIALDSQGRVRDFEMNDRCAAGTGKFLEVMAKALGFSIEELGREALKATNPVKISSVCTVFAESEAISLIAQGEDRRDIAYGIHEAIAERVVGMLNRLSIKENLFFAGGVALNHCLRKILEEKLKSKIYIPQNPQVVGAVGAALCAQGEKLDN